MRYTVVQPDGDLKREVWDFDLGVDYQIKLRLDYFAFQTRPSTRHRKWQVENCWNRLTHRDNTIKSPPYSSEAVEEAKQYFIEQIKSAGVVT
jgi:hypothetical protein